MGGRVSELQREGMLGGALLANLRGVLSQVASRLPSSSSLSCSLPLVLLFSSPSSSSSSSPSSASSFSPSPLSSPLLSCSGDLGGVQSQ
eukprot:40865-Rhodomonas_salina.1